MLLSSLVIVVFAWQLLLWSGIQTCMFFLRISKLVDFNSRLAVGKLFCLDGSYPR